MNVSIGVSARHVHVSRGVLDVLFGKNYVLHNKKDLHQPTQFAAWETIVLATEKGKIENVRILGPVRDYTQVEISKTDAYKLGLCPPIRDSGDIKGSASITLIGPKGKVDLEEGCIIATRHIHVTPQERIQKGLTMDEVCVKIDSEKGATIEHVHIKEADLSYFELHLDTDDANALCVKDGDIGEIIK